MANFLAQSADWLAGQLQLAAGRQAVLVRGGVELGCVTGTVAMQMYEVVEEDGSLTTIHAVDWTFRYSSLPAVPRPGDRLREQLRCQVVEYELIPIGKRPAIEDLDTSGIMLLAHSKRVAPGT